MNQITANVSPLIPSQFPVVYQQEGPGLVNFVQAYYAWMEQSNNVAYYTRNIYNIKDVDTSFDQFIIYFKEKYLKNIKFATETNIRTVIKHALDIYRSKGTERCAQLIFQLAFNVTPDFYYPSTDLLRPSDGQWVIQNYLELSLSSNNVLLQSKEIMGPNSGATAYVDRMIRRRTLNYLEDVAYISVINGNFVAGEKVVPTDNSLFVDYCPSILGSLIGISIANTGSGNNYAIGEVVTVSSNTGEGGFIRISNTINQTGYVSLGYNDGGWGYSISEIYANIAYNAVSNTNAANTVANNTNIYSYYGNGSLRGTGLILSSNAAVSNAGIMHVLVLSGEFSNAINSGNVFTHGNLVHANIVSYSQTSSYIVNAVPFPNGCNVYISNASLTLANISFNSVNTEDGHYFSWFETITQNMSSINYAKANGSFTVGANLYVWSGGSVVGQGVIMTTNPANSTAGQMLVSVSSGSMNPASNAYYTYSNAIGANNAATNGYSNATATGIFIANSSVLNLNVNNISGSFIAGETVYQGTAYPGPTPGIHSGGWGIVSEIFANTIVLINAYGRFITGGVDTIVGGVSGATANVVSSQISVGIVNVVNSFFVSPYGQYTSLYTNGVVQNFYSTGSGLNVVLANSLLYAQTVTINTDQISTYGSLALNATAYGFPANPLGNVSSTIASCLNELTVTVGKLSNAYVSGIGNNYGNTPFIVVDEPYVSNIYVYNAVLSLSNQTGQFTTGEIVNQGNLVQAMVTPIGNSSCIEVQMLSYPNSFINTVNSTTFLVGVSSGTSANIVNVDFDYLGPVMGRNVVLEPIFATGSNAVSSLQVVSSGYGYKPDQVVTIGANGATGTAVIGGTGFGPGFYQTNGGRLDDVKKLYDGYFYQAFSYQIISPFMIDKYQEMIQQLTHVAGTIMFGKYVHNSVSGNGLNFSDTTILLGNVIGANGLTDDYTNNQLTTNTIINIVEGGT